MWENYGMTFIEYIFLNQIRKSNSHMNIEGKEILLEILREKNLLYLFQDILLILNSCQWKYQK